MATNDNLEYIKEFHRLIFSNELTEMAHRNSYGMEDEMIKELEVLVNDAYVSNNTNWINSQWAYSPKDYMFFRIEDNQGFFSSYAPIYIKTKRDDSINTSDGAMIYADDKIFITLSLKDMKYAIGTISHEVQHVVDTIVYQNGTIYYSLRDKTFYDDSAKLLNQLNIDDKWKQIINDVLYSSNRHEQDACEYAVRLCLKHLNHNTVRQLISCIQTNKDVQTTINVITKLTPNVFYAFDLQRMTNVLLSLKDLSNEDLSEFYLILFSFWRTTADAKKYMSYDVYTKWYEIIEQGSSMSLTDIESLCVDVYTAIYNMTFERYKELVDIIIDEINNYILNERDGSVILIDSINYIATHIPSAKLVESKSHIEKLENSHFFPLFVNVKNYMEYLLMR